MLSQFREWYESERRGNTRIRILLMDPADEDLLEYQARYQWGLFQEPLTEEQKARISESVASSKAAIEYTHNLLLSLPDSSSHIEVRYHGERLRRWMCLVDGGTAYLGILRKGDNGLRAPVIVLRAQAGRWTLFDHYQEEWESLWASATPRARAARQ